jgi:polyisoprenoid-binding protein YceI
MVTSRSGARRWGRWLAVGVAVVVAVAVAGPYVYIHFFEGKAAKPLALSDSGSGTTGGGVAASGDGTWVVASGSQVGYRVKEVLFGQDNTAVGRTRAISGKITIAGTTVTTATFTADLTSVTSDQSRRDGSFQTRIMDTASYPTATFTLTQPIRLGSIPAEGTAVTVRASGTLAMHGVTRGVQVSLTARHGGGQIQVSGSLPVRFADWNIPNPSFGPVTTEDHGVLEFLLKLARG